MLRVSPRTVEKWEQGGQVSPLAATFVELVLRYPDTVERLQTLPKRVSHFPKKSSTNSHAITVKELFSAAGLPVCGPVPWKKKVSESRPGVYVVATVSDPEDESGVDHVADLPREIATRWVPSQPVLYVGQTSRQTLATRINQFYRHKHGAASPHRGGQDIKLLSCQQWVYWSPTEWPLEAEKKMIEEFELRACRLPFGNLKHPSRKIMDSRSITLSV
jgi:hypothetical protein